ncbi:MAG TPA: YsnF/AvaK domain-containing protein, partial [Pyrinomonadaceae bacterium]|nr:YsnF/AvaK domain-containing protein [Pyrinomonadaceae bacterium]
MAKTVIGLFDDHDGAQEAVRELLEEGFRREDISVMTKELRPHAAERAPAVEYVEEDGHEQVEDMAKGAGKGAAIGGAAGLLLGLTALAIPGIGPVLAAGPLAAAVAGAGFGGTIGGLISGLTRLGANDEQANTYAEGVRRGGTVVSVNVPDEAAATVVTIMKENGAVEIDKRAAQWRDEGWTGIDAGQAFAAYEGGRTPADRPSRVDGSSEITAEHERIAPQALAGGASEGQVAIPVVEEQLELEKREVERGGVRVHTRVSEQPFEEEVSLREERVNVERRPVNYTFHGSESDAFKEALVEIREAYEELIVNKKARVVEEIVVNKEVEQHTETVRETLRRTDVDEEPIEPSAEGPDAPGRLEAREPFGTPARVEPLDLSEQERARVASAAPHDDP